MLRNAFILLLCVLFILVCAPLITPVLMGGVLAMLFWPWMERLEDRKIHSGWSAAVITLGFSILVLMPISLLVIFAAKSGLAEVRVLQQQWQVTPGMGSEGESILSQLAHHPAVLKVIEKVTRFFPVQTDELLATVIDVLKVVGLKLGELLGVIVAKIPGMTLAVVVAMVSLYFFLVDGKKLTIFVKRNSFFTPAQTAELMTQLGVMARSVILASVLSGVAQSLVMTVAMAFASGSNVGMVAFLVFLCSFLPLVGSAPVTLFVTAGAFLKGDTQAGVILAAGAIAAGLVDNLVRPWVLKGGANLHPLLGFVAAFGGLQFFGLSGLFLGPIIAGLFVAVLRIQTRA